MTGEVPFRVVVRRPPAGVAFGIQRGRDEILRPVEEGPEALTFELSIRVVLQAGEGPNFLGEFAQGPKGARFVYLNSGKRAGQQSSGWDRRAKISLTEISSSMVKEVLKDGATLETIIEGVGRDGGPVCGSVRGASWHRAA